MCTSLMDLLFYKKQELLNILWCPCSSPFQLCFVTFCLFAFVRVLCPILPISLDFPFLIAPLVFSNIYLSVYNKKKTCIVHKCATISPPVARTRKSSRKATLVHCSLPNLTVVLPIIGQLNIWGGGGLYYLDKLLSGEMMTISILYRPTRLVGCHWQICRSKWTHYPRHLINPSLFSLLIVFCLAQKQQMSILQYLDLPHQVSNPEYITV